MNHEYAHYKNYPKDKWRWPNFTAREMRSKGDNKLMIDGPSMDMLQELRDMIGKPFSITSAYRSPAHNKTVGGAKKSKHLEAIAFDIKMAGHNPAQFEAAAREVGFTGFGFYKSSNFIHIDTGPAREWGKRWFTKALFWEGPVSAPDMAEVTEQMDKFPKPPRYVISSPTKKSAVVGPVAGGIAAIVLALWLGLEKIIEFIGGLF